jgi:putative ABC transport system permease protein
MLLHFFTTVTRALVRNRFFNLLNVFGLALSISCCLVIYQFLKQQLSYDYFHSEKENIYRVIRQSSINGMDYDIGITSAPFAGALANDFPHDITETTRVFHTSALVQSGDKSFLENNFMLGDPDFFTFFSFPLKNGDPRQVLSQPNFVVVSSEIAQKYFGNEDPINKTLRVDNAFDVVVTGVMDELPGPTHLQFDMMGSIQLIEHEPWMKDWWNNNLNTYIRVPSPAQATTLQAALPDFMTKYFGKDFEKARNRIELGLEPLEDIYFNNLTRYERGVVHGDRMYVYIFSSVAVLLIILAAINYTNLATAQSATRSTEVGIRKSLGSSRSAIATQFLIESLVLCLLSFVLAIGFVEAVVPLVEREFGLSFDGFFMDPGLWILSSVLVLVITLLAGGYPALLLASLKPVSIMRKETTGSMRFLFTRKVLVVFQFGISIMMIIATIVISEQLHFLRSNDLGFDAANISIIRLNNETMGKQRNAFRELLLQRPEIQSVAMMSNEPGSTMFDASSVQVQGEEDFIRMRTLWADEEFTNTLNVPVLAGRFFSPSFPADSLNAVVLNRTAVLQLGWKPEEALGKRVMISQFDSLYKSVVGVVDDFHFISLRNKIEPLIISYGGAQVMAVKLNGANLKETMKFSEEIWTSFGHGFPMEWSFLDHTLQQQYRQEANQNRIFNVFATVSLIIACLGILGLTAIISVRRTREIGVRKVLGATIFQVCILLMKDMVTMIVVAAVIVTPFAWLLITRWLEGFAYHVPLSATWFILGALLVFIVSLTVAASQALVAARQNPVRALRTE